MQCAVGRDNHYAARQIFKHPGKIRPHTRVFLKASLQLGVRALQLVMQAGNLCLQLGIGLLKRTSGLRKRQKSSCEAFLRRDAPAQLYRAAHSLPGSRHFWHHCFRCTLSARSFALDLDFSYLPAFAELPKVFHSQIPIIPGENEGSLDGVLKFPHIAVPAGLL